MKKINKKQNNNLVPGIIFLIIGAVFIVYLLISIVNGKLFTGFNKNVSITEYVTKISFLIFGIASILNGLFLVKGKRYIVLLSIIISSLIMIFVPIVTINAQPYNSNAGQISKIAELNEKKDSNPDGSGEITGEAANAEAEILKDNLQRENNENICISFLLGIVCAALITSAIFYDKKNVE